MPQEKARRKEKQNGIEEGAKEKQIEIAKKLLKMEMTNKQVKEATNLDEEEIKIPDISLDEQEIEESVTTDIKEEMIETLKDLGIDYLDFTSDEIEKLMDNFDKDTIIGNIKYMQNKGFENDIYINHIELMYDKNLQNKVELLLSIGKEVLDIYLAPSILTKYTYEQLGESIQSLRGSGMDPKEVPLMAY